MSPGPRLRAGDLALVVLVSAAAAVAVATAEPAVGVLRWQAALHVALCAAVAGTLTAATGRRAAAVGAALAASLHPAALEAVRGLALPAPLPHDAWQFSISGAAHVADAIAASLWPPALSLLAVTGKPPLGPVAAALLLLAGAWGVSIVPALRPLRGHWWTGIALAASAWLAGAAGTPLLQAVAMQAALVVTGATLAACVLATAHRRVRAAGAVVALAAAASSVLVLPRWTTGQGVVEAAVASFPGSSRARLALAATASARGDEEGALASLREALTLAPTDLEVRRAAGRAYYARGDWDEASRHLAKAVEADGASDDATIVAAAEATARAGQALHARAILERGVAARPASSALAVALSQFLAEKGDAATALATLEKTVREHGDDAVAWSELAKLHASAGRVHDSVECWRRAVALSPGDAEAKAGLGRSLRDSDDLDGAASMFSAALTIDPAKRDVEHDLARVLARLERYDDAAAVYARLRSGPAPSRASAAMASHVAWEHGVVLAAAGRDAEAAAAFGDALRADPANVDAAGELAWLLATAREPKTGDAEAALYWAARAAAARPRDPSSLDTLAAAQAANGNFEAAAASAEKALELGSAYGDEAWGEAVRSRLAAYREGRTWTRVVDGGRAASAHDADH